MEIIVNKENDELISITINGETFDFEDENQVTVPISAIKAFNCTDMPSGILFSLCDSIQDGIILTDMYPTICTFANGVASVTIDELNPRKYWDGPVGLKLWMDTKKAIIEDRNSKVGDISLDHYDDDGNYISLEYSFEITVPTVSDLVNSIHQLTNEIDGATDIALGSPFEKIENCTHESDFTTKILIPLFRSLGFSNVKYNHGTREFGKDITFSRYTEFANLEYYGVQVKKGDISGGAHGDILELIEQAKLAFSMPFYDVYSREKVYISKFIIAISGSFSNNAIEVIIDGLHDYPLKNNIVFLDGEKIKNLLEKYRKF